MHIDEFPQPRGGYSMSETPLRGDPVKKRKNLSPESKFQIFLESSRGDVPIAEILRKWDIHSSDLKRIRETVQSGAIKEFQAHKNRKPLVSTDEVDRLRKELLRLEKTVVEQSVELALLKKSVNGT
jgi:transposase